MLRYAGGKTRAIQQLKLYIPDDTSQLVSAFLGGGSFELYLSNRIQVHASDMFEPLIAFWSCMKTQRKDLVDALKTKPPFTKELFYACKKALHDGTMLEKAVKFFIVNRCSFSGTITGGYTATRSPMSCIDRLKDIDLTNIDVRCCDYEEQLNLYPNMFAFLDPPYDVPNLYGTQTFNHERLADVLRSRQSKWILCYNDTPTIRRLYQDWCNIIPLQWSYGMNKTRKSNEILILPTDWK